MHQACHMYGVCMTSILSCTKCVPDTLLFGQLGHICIHISHSVLLCGRSEAKMHRKLIDSQILEQHIYISMDRTKHMGGAKCYCLTSQEC